MVFSSVSFLFIFLPVCIALYFLFPTNRLKNIFLLLSSLTFYFWGAQELLWVILLSAFVDYFLGLFQHKTKKLFFKRIALILSLTVNLGLLFYFKYTFFFLQTISAGPELIKYAQNIILPLGISFYTFQTLSYQIDLYKGETEVQKNFFDFALFVSLFPQLIAGPIVRYKDLSLQLKNRVHSLDKFTYGISRFIQGLIKKIIIADTLARFVDVVFSQNPANLDSFYSILGSVCFCFQLYYDFSGYSDMAIGLSSIFGFKLKENFLYPLYARSITAFWQFWHISLTTWLRDYLYMPLSGLSTNKAYRLFCLIFVFTVCGLWHGANWTFILFGFYFGIILVIERLYWKRFGRHLPKIIQHSYVWVVLIIAGVLFRSPNLEYAWKYYGSFINLNQYNAEVTYAFDNEIKTSLTLAIIFSVPLLNILYGYNFTKKPLMRPLISGFQHATILLGFFIALILAGARTYNPFVYFQF